MTFTKRWGRQYLVTTPEPVLTIEQDRRSSWWAWLVILLSSWASGGAASGDDLITSNVWIRRASDGDVLSVQGPYDWIVSKELVDGWHRLIEERGATVALREVIDRFGPPRSDPPPPIRPSSSSKHRTPHGRRRRRPALVTGPTSPRAPRGWRRTRAARRTTAG